MTDRVDVVIVGGGIVGLAAARRLQLERPGIRVTVCEKDAEVAGHQTSHNSGVVHAGIYYPPGSLKARLCREGKPLLEAFARDHGVRVETSGKVVVATRPQEVRGLRDLYDRSMANEVPGLAWLDATGLAEVEPHAAGLAALHSPTTAVTDFAEIARALAAEVATNGGEVRTDTPVTALHETGDRVRVGTGDGTIDARVVLACAGAQSDRVAALTGDEGDLRVVPFRGAYLLLAPAARHLVRGNIYPVPDPRFPFLGVHFTKRLDGEVLVGPNALLSGAREDYERGALHWPDVRANLTFPGFWKLARTTLGAGARELWLDRVRPAYLRQMQRYLPELTRDHLVPGPTGVRAQAVRSDGSLVDDFVIDATSRVVHVRNAPSPAATASFAIARRLAGEVTDRLT